jgi:hypothetical protein
MIEIVFGMFTIDIALFLGMGLWKQALYLSTGFSTGRTIKHRLNRV